MSIIKVRKIAIEAAVLLVSLSMLCGIVFADSADFSLYANVRQDTMTKEATLTIFINPSQAQVAYNIDDKENVTLPQSSVSFIQGHYMYTVVLTELSEGNHKVNVYAKFAGETRFINQTFSFVQDPAPTQTLQQTPNLGLTQTPFNPMLALITVFVLSLIITIILLVFYNKNKKEK